MVIRSVRHRGLRRLIEDDNSRFLGRDLVDRVRKILTALILAENMDSFITDAPPRWRVHRLLGDSETNGAFRYPAIGGSLLKKMKVTFTA